MRGGEGEVRNRDLPKRFCTFHSLIEYHIYKTLYAIVQDAIGCLPVATRKCIQKQIIEIKKLNGNSSFRWLRSYNCWKLIMYT